MVGDGGRCTGIVEDDASKCEVLFSLGCALARTPEGLQDADACLQAASQFDPRNERFATAAAEVRAHILELQRAKEKPAIVPPKPAAVSSIPAIPKPAASPFARPAIPSGEADGHSPNPTHTHIHTNHTQSHTRTCLLH